MFGILTNIQQQQLARRVESFTLQNKVLCHMGQNNIFQWCVTTKEAHKILWELHEGFGGGHFIVDIIAKKILVAHVNSRCFSIM
jgi:hypothetical protein